MSWSEKYKRSIDCDNPKGFSQKAHCQGRKKKLKEQFKPFKTPEQIAKKHRLEVSFIEKQLQMGEPIEHEHTKDHKLAREIALQHLDEIPDYYTRLKKMEADAKKHHKKFKDVKEHCGCEEDAVKDLEVELKKLKDVSYDSIDKLMRRIMKQYDMTARQLHDAFINKHDKTPDEWIENLKEETKSGDQGLRDWFRKSESSDGKAGWVQLGGKWAGKPCARQPGQTSTPKCGSSKMAANLSPEEEERARRRKNRLDPNQPEKSGGAKPTNVRTEEMDLQEVKDKPGKGSGKKDACYKKVKSRYDVWPSAYASGALVKCRKVGAANWGTKSEELEMIRYCPKCKKNETKSECKYGPKYWEMFSIPSALTSNQLKYDPNRPHPANEEKDHEYSMARSELSTIISAAKRLRKKVKGEGNIEAWVQSKITKAADYIDTAADYLESGEHKVNEDCWDGYKQVGMKKKGKKMVPNCVPESVSIEDANGNHYVDFIDIIKPEPLKASTGLGSKLLDEGPSFEIGGKKTTGMGAMTPSDVERLKQGNPGAAGKIDQKYQQIRRGINLPLAKKEDKKETQVAHYEPEGEQIDEVVGMVARLAAKGILKAAKPVGKAILRSVDDQIAKSTAQTAKRIASKPKVSGTAKITYKPSNSTVQYGGGKPSQPKLTRSQAQQALDDDPWTKGAFSADDRRRVALDRRALNNHYEYSNWREELSEDWQKVNRQDKTDGLSQKAVNAYRRENPGSKLQTAVTEKNPKGKRAKRRTNFCRRMKGMKERLTSAETARDPDSRINKALRRWRCN